MRLSKIDEIKIKNKMLAMIVKIKSTQTADENKISVMTIVAIN